MGLERKLAEIQVLVDDMVSCAYGNLAYEHLWGIENEADGLITAKRNVQRFLAREQISLAKYYLGEFAVSAKNLAENVKQFIQMTYSGEVNLRQSLKDIPEIPQTIDGKNLHQIFSETHSYSKDDLLIKIRNAKSHGKIHLLGFVESHLFTPAVFLPSRAKIKTDYYFDTAEFHSGKKVLVKDWVEQKSNEYLDLAVACLGTIVDEDKKRFKPHSQKRNWRILHCQYDNAVERHFREVAATGAVLLMLGMIGGAAAWNIHTRDVEKRIVQQMKEECEQDFARSIYAIELKSGVRKNYENWEYGISGEIEENLLVESIKETIKISPENARFKYNPQNPIYKKAVEEIEKTDEGR